MGRRLQPISSGVQMARRSLEVGGVARVGRTGARGSGAEPVSCAAESAHEGWRGDEVTTVPARRGYRDSWARIAMPDLTGGAGGGCV